MPESTHRLREEKGKNPVSEPQKRARVDIFCSSFFFGSFLFTFQSVDDSYNNSFVVLPCGEGRLHFGDEHTALSFTFYLRSSSYSLLTCLSLYLSIGCCLVGRRDCKGKMAKLVGQDIVDADHDWRFLCLCRCRTSICDPVGRHGSRTRVQGSHLPRQRA